MGPHTSGEERSILIRQNPVPNAPRGPNQTPGKNATQPGVHLKVLKHAVSSSAIQAIASEDGRPSQAQRHSRKTQFSILANDQR